MSRYKIGLGVTGGIAAYKAVELMRLLQKAGCSVSVAMTKHSTEFVTPLTFRALADGPVIVDDYDPSNPDADDDGYVTYPNVNTVTEMTNLIDANRAFEANATAFASSKNVVEKGLNILTNG